MLAWGLVEVMVRMSAPHCAARKGFRMKGNGWQPLETMAGGALRIETPGGEQDGPAAGGGAAVLRIVLNRPEKLNAVGRELAAALRDAFRSCAAREGLRCVVLTGEGKAFIGGADIGEMAGLDAAGARSFITGLHEVCAAIRACPVPVVAQINGYCLGGGLEVAAAADIRLAADTAHFGMPEVKVGIPSVIEAALLPPLIGWGRTRDILLTGRGFTAAEALDWGFLSAAVPLSDLQAAVDGRVAEILEAGPHAVRLQKRLIGRWEELALSQQIAAGIDSFAQAYADSDEPARMMAAALEAMARRRRERPDR